MEVLKVRDVESLYFLKRVNIIYKVDLMIKKYYKHIIYNYDIIK